MTIVKRLICSCLLGGILSSPLPAAAIAQKGKPAPPVALNTITGQPLNLNAWRGKVLLLDFFATWCSPCRAAIPHLNELQNRFGRQGLQVIGLSVDDLTDKQLVREFVIANKIGYPVALTTEDLREDFGLVSIPTMMLLNKQGVVIEIFRGSSEGNKKRLETLIGSLLKE